jgi:agmatinase
MNGGFGSASWLMNTCEEIPFGGRKPVTKYMKFEEAMAELEQGLPPAEGAGFLGVNIHPEDAKLVMIPVAWEATTSYGGGTSDGPDAVVAASHQLDMEDAAFGKAFRAGIVALEEDTAIRALNEKAKAAAQNVIAACEQRSEAVEDLRFVNESSVTVNDSVYQSAKHWLGKGKFVGLIGGDHSSPQGLIRALAETVPGGFGVLHFDAHHDFRNAYEGFKYSHASIFYNVMTSYEEVTKITQVGIRDYSRDERAFMESLGPRGSCFYGRDLFRRKAEGETFKAVTASIISTLPQNVYVSFDIDGLDPSYCPSTGTPVPGGLSFEEACYILEALANSGRRVVGFDLTEVAPGPEGSEWDANVGARLLYKLCGCLLRSQKLC